MFSLLIKQTLAVVLVCVFFVGQNSRVASCGEVLIIYANETAPDRIEIDNSDTIIRWLESSELERVREIANQLKRDRQYFPAVVDQEISSLRGALPTAAQGLAVVIFTNRSVRNGKYFFTQSSEKKWRLGSIKPVVSDNYILQSYPLSNPMMFQLVLRTVAQRFDGNQHEFILVTKSHGNEKMAMTPRIVVRHQETSREELLAVAANTLPGSKRPAWLDHRLGITKDRYFEILENAGESLGMRFSLVFMESCKSGLSDEPENRYLPRNVRRVFATIDENTHFSNLDYAHLLKGYSSDSQFSHLMGEVLEHNFTSITTRPFQYHLVGYFIPLGLFCTYLAIRKKRGPRQLSAMHTRFLASR